MLAILTLILCACADPDPPAWCELFCAAQGRQAQRCFALDRDATRAACSRQLSCERVTSVRDRAELVECLNGVEGSCSAPVECVRQFRE